MTLVVAKKISNEGVIVLSDTKLTYSLNYNFPASFQISKESYLGVLKTVLVTPGLSISFAGNVEYARRSIEGIYNQNINLNDVQSILNFFLQKHIESNRTTDYIVVGNLSHGYEIFKIADGVCINSGSSCWIGDVDGFRVLQGYLNNCLLRVEEVGHSELRLMASSEERNLSEPIRSEANKYFLAFLETLKSSSCPSVGGTPSIVMGDKNRLTYSEALYISGPAKEAINAVGRSKPLWFGNETTGSFIFQAGREISWPVHLVDFQFGKFGVIYSPTISFRGKLINYVDKEELNSEFQKSIEEFKEVSNRFFNHS